MRIANAEYPSDDKTVHITRKRTQKEVFLSVSQQTKDGTTVLRQTGWLSEPLEGDDFDIIRETLENEDLGALYSIVVDWIIEDQYETSLKITARIRLWWTQDRIESFVLWIIGAALLASAIAQTLFQNWLVSIGYWAHSPGYQFEISIWNIAILLGLIVPAALVRNYGLRCAAFGVVTLFCLGFGANHGLSALHEPTPAWHAWLALVEIFTTAVTFGLIAWRGKTEWSRSPDPVS